MRNALKFKIRDLYYIALVIYTLSLNIQLSYMYNGWAASQSGMLLVLKAMHYGAYLLSYSDPNITETFDVYAALADFLANYEADQDTLDGYIMAAYSALAATDGELFGAISAVNRRMCGIPDDLRVQQMEQLKSLTPEKLQTYAEAYQALSESGDLFTIGGSAAIHEHEDLYDLILDPLKDFG